MCTTIPCTALIPVGIGYREPETRVEQSEDIPVHTPSAPGFGAVVMSISVPEWVGLAGE